MKNQEIEKKFSCSLCNYSTNYNHDLKRHFKAKHSAPHPENIKKFKCEHCKFSTNYKHNILRHTELKHGLGEKKTVKRGRECKSTGCLCLPMFYIVQIPK